VFRIGQASRGQFHQKLGLALILTALWSAPPALQAKESPDVTSGTVALAALPIEAQQTQALIQKGGPFPYRKDGSTFGNRERLLPAKPRGFYKEYTVKTAGSPDRGARRIVCGGSRQTQPEACFYTADHYASFRRIVQ
jgi:ribonuclease T1